MRSISGITPPGPACEPGQKPPKNPKTLAPGTVKRELTLLKRVIDYRKRRLGLLVNPVNTEDVKRPAVNDERNIRLGAKEIERLLKACDQAENKWLRAFVELGFETGIGAAACLGSAGRMLIFAGARRRCGKNSRSPENVIDHAIGLSPRAITVLKSLRRDSTEREDDDDDRVFPVTANALRLSFNRARKKAGVPHFRFHDTLPRTHLVALRSWLVVNPSDGADRP